MFDDQPGVDDVGLVPRTRQRNGERPLRAARTAAGSGGGDERQAPPLRVALDPAILLGANDDEILRGYLDLVRTWRGTRRRTVLPLRAADVAVLVSILGTDSTEIERRLIGATACTTAAAKRGRRLLLASLGALTVGLIGTSVAGAVTLTGGATPLPLPTNRTRASINSTNEHVALPTAVIARLAPTPIPTPASGQSGPPEVAAPTRATVVLAPGTEATVSIPSLGIDLPVIEGGQSVIDEGVAAHYSADGWKEPVAPGAPGTYWLAAHHVTYGAPFKALPNIAVGAQIRVTTNSQTFIYTVTSTEVVGLLPGDVAIYGTDETSPVILLQTCIDDTRRFLAHGTLSATL
jgi:LPXTG-site transpeptidase (sortase) family protein